MDSLSKSNSLDSKEIDVLGRGAFKYLLRLEVYSAAEELNVKFRQDARKNKPMWILFLIEGIGRSFLSPIISPSKREIVLESIPNLIKYNQKMAVAEYQSLSKKKLSAEEERFYIEKRVERIESSRVLSSLYENRIINGASLSRRDQQVLYYARKVAAERGGEALTGVFVITAVSGVALSIANKAWKK